MMKRADKKGFTLVETLTVLAIIGIFIGFFYTLFSLNWQACEQFLARADMGQDMDRTMDQIADDGRNAASISVNSNGKQAMFMNSDGAVQDTYTMSANGEMTITQGGAPVILTEKIDYANSNFAHDGQAIAVNMDMTDQVLGRTVTLNSATEIYPRNGNIAG